MDVFLYIKSKDVRMSHCHVCLVGQKHTTCLPIWNQFLLITLHYNINAYKSICICLTYLQISYASQKQPKGHYTEELHLDFTAPFKAFGRKPPNMSQLLQRTRALIQSWLGKLESWKAGKPCRNAWGFEKSLIAMTLAAHSSSIYVSQSNHAMPPAGQQAPTWRP